MAREQETTPRFDGQTDCFSLLVPGTDPLEAGKLILDAAEYKTMLPDGFVLTKYRSNPVTPVRYGFRDSYPTTFCEPESSHVPYFEALWEKKQL